jgi:hypothetical protein
MNLFTPGFSNRVGVTQSIVFYVVLCRLLFLVLSFFVWPLYCMSFFDVRLLITPLVSFDHCIVCSSLMYGFWLPLWYLQTFLCTFIIKLMTIWSYPVSPDVIFTSLEYLFKQNFKVHLKLHDAIIFSFRRNMSHLYYVFVLNRNTKTTCTQTTHNSPYYTCYICTDS